MPEATKTKAVEACLHILRRVKRCPNFAHYMLGTESLSLCFQAVAEFNGCREEKIRDDVEVNAATHKQDADVVEMQRTIDRLESELSVTQEGVASKADELEEAFSNAAEESWAQMQAVRRVLHLATIAGRDIPVDELEAAIEGRIFVGGS